MGSRLGNGLGAFADGAVLFPLAAALALKPGFDSAVLFFSTGVMYLLSGWYFRIPMSVQPLKAIAIAAIASDASYLEVRWAGAVVGLYCLLMWALKTDRLAEYIPRHLVHGIQAGLGLMLLRRAAETSAVALPNLGGSGILIASVGCLFLVVVSKNTGLTSLGLLAAGATALALQTSMPSAIAETPSGSTRWSFVVLLALPQLVLTTANSVIATQDAAKRYFGERASRVTISSLFGSIGLGNLATAALGGLPFCHGSGGLTAHVRGGSTHWSSNIIIGLFLLGLAFFQWLGGRATLIYPPILLAGLLAVVGYHHLGLVAPSWKRRELRFTLVVMGLTAAATQNLLWSLGGGLACELFSRFILGKRVAI